MKQNKAFVPYRLNGISFGLPNFMKLLGKMTNFDMAAKEFRGKRFISIRVLEPQSPSEEGLKRLVDVPPNSSSMSSFSIIKYEKLVRPTCGKNCILECTLPNGAKDIGWLFYLEFGKRFVQGEIRILGKYSFIEEEPLWNTVIESFKLVEQE